MIQPLTGIACIAIAKLNHAGHLQIGILLRYCLTFVLQFLGLLVTLGNLSLQVDNLLSQTLVLQNKLPHTGFEFPQ